MKACSKCGSFKIVGGKCADCGGIEIMECKMYTLPKMTSMLDRHEAEGIEMLDILNGVGPTIDSIKEWMRDTNFKLNEYREMLSLHLELGRDHESRIEELEVEMDRKVDMQPGYYPERAAAAPTRPLSLIKQISTQQGENLMSVPVDELDLEHMTKFYAEHKACGAGNIMLDCASTGIGACVDIRCFSCGKVQTIYGVETW